MEAFKSNSVYMTLYSLQILNSLIKENTKNHANSALQVKNLELDLELVVQQGKEESKFINKA